jgi:uncharacterized MAPEG superfamily protein
MSTELTVLTLAALLQVVQFLLMSVPTNLELGQGKTMGARDPDRLGKPIVEQVSPTTGRLIRAMNNHFEALILFTIAVLVIELSGQSNTLTKLCAHTYLIARIFYIPAYAQGLTPWRSIIWAIGFLATVVMLLAALF